MYIKIDNNRFQTATFSDYAGKNTPEAIQVDCGIPSKYHRLKTNYQDFSGAEQWEVSTTKKQEIIAKLEVQINQQTDSDILTGFHYGDDNYYLSLENQMNFKAMNDIRDSLTYPVKVKHQAGYAMMANADEFHSFYLAGMAYIQQKINEGWDAKDALRNKTTAQLIEML